MLARRRREKRRKRRERCEGEDQELAEAEGATLRTYKTRGDSSRYSEEEEVCDKAERPRCQTACAAVCSSVQVSSTTPPPNPPPLVSDGGKGMAAMHRTAGDRQRRLACWRRELRDSQLVPLQENRFVHY